MGHVAWTQGKLSSHAVQPGRTAGGEISLTNRLTRLFRKLARDLALRTPGLRGLAAELSVARQAARFVPPGHFYSPIPALEDVERDAARLFDLWPAELPGIDLNENGQVALLSQLSSYYPELPFSDHGARRHRFSFDNPMYSGSDAVCLYAMLRHVRPRRVIEVGSGHSSCLILDTNELFLDNQVACTFIDPFPQRLLSLLRPEDHARIEIVTRPVQTVEIERFRQLEANDVLFIDSSHVAKIGSDVNHFFANVLPVLRPGVYVHFDDIYYPFEYPRQWVNEGRFWNEAYLLRAFLTFNSAFKVTLFDTFLRRFHRVSFAQMPLCLSHPGSSIWLQRVE